MTESPIHNAQVASDNLGKLPQIAAALETEVGLERWLASGAVDKWFQPGTIIFREGARPTSFYIVLSGFVDVLRKESSEPEGLIERLGPGEFFGEIGLLEDRARTATVRVSVGGPAQLLEISGEAFETCMRTGDEGAQNVAAISRARIELDSLATAFPMLNAQELENLAGSVSHKSFSQGETVFGQGTPADCLYVVAMGRVEVLLERPDGRTFLFDFHDPGDYFGEIGLLAGGNRSATVRAAEESDLLVLDRPVFEELLSRTDELRTAVTQQATERLKRMTRSGE